MSDLVKILFVLALLVVLLRHKVNFGVVMLVGASVLALLYLTPPLRFIQGAWRGISSPRTMEMVGMLVFTMIMENILRKTGTLKRMVASLAVMLPDRRHIMAAMPAMIGMLPSMGGAVFSAPMVAEAADGLPVKAEQKAFINYWFRHPWEYISPLYPGIILVAGLSQLPFRILVLMNTPFAAAMFLVGGLFCFRGVARAETPAGSSKETWRALGDFILAVAPIMTTLLLVVAAGVNPVAALAGMTALLYLAHRYTPGRIVESLRESVSLKTLFLVAGIMVFKETLELTGSLDGISRYFAASGLPPLLIIIVLPFLAGVMTGLTVAFVGITFPILLPLMGGVPPSVGLLAVAFGSGFAGVMLSPLHLCLVLTGEYFGADPARVYRRLWIPVALVLAAGGVSLYIYR